MLSIQEIIDKTKPQLDQIEATMDSWGQFHPDMKTPEKTRCTIYDGAKPALTAELKQSLRAIPLKEILVSGIAGAANLVPSKIHDELIYFSKKTDVCPLIGRVVTGWKGGNLKVNIVDDTSYIGQEFAGAGAAIPTETVKSVQATITPKSFAVNVQITSDLIENSAYDLVEYHLQKAAEAMGDKASELALTVLKTATDGVGTVNGGVSGDADETKWTGASTAGVDTCLAALTDDHWIPNTIIMTPEAWEHSVQTTMPALANNIPVQYNLPPPAEGFHMKIGVPPMDLLFSTNAALHAAAKIPVAMTDCVTIIYDRNNGLLTGRKRWLQINNYAHPIDDLEGAVISARQDSVTLYDDAIAVITES